MTEVAKPCKKIFTLKWYALHTRARWEKKVCNLLQQQGFESYCPVIKSRRKWSDRYKIIEEPLIKGCVIVKVDEKGRGPVRMTSGVINFVHKNSKPVVFKEKEISQLQKFLNDHGDVEVMEDSKVNGDEQLLRKISIPALSLTIVAKNKPITAITN